MKALVFVCVALCALAQETFSASAALDA